MWVVIIFILFCSMKEKKESYDNPKERDDDPHQKVRIGVISLFFVDLNFFVGINNLAAYLGDLSIIVLYCLKPCCY